MTTQAGSQEAKFESRPIRTEVDSSVVHQSWTRQIQMPWRSRTPTPHSRRPSRRAQWNRRTSAQACGAVVYSILLLGLGLGLGRAGTNRRPGATSAMLAPSIPDLDSFSEPSIAVAILKRHGQALHEACAQGLSQLTGEDFQARVPEWIARHEAELNRQKELRNGLLEYRLLSLYSTSRRGEELVDCYLRLLRVSPRDPVLHHWAASALRHARSCGRSDELLDALRHIAQFDRDPEAAGRVRSVLDRWTAEDRAKSLALAQ